MLTKFKLVSAVLQCISNPSVYERPEICNTSRLILLLIPQNTFVHLRDDLAMFTVGEGKKVFFCTPF